MRGQDLKSKSDAEITARLDAKVSGEKAGGGDQLDQFKMRQTLADNALKGTANSPTKGATAADLISVSPVPRSPAAMMVDDSRLTPTSSQTAAVVASAALTDSGQFSGQSAGQSSGGQSNGSGSNSGHAGTASATSQANLIELLDTAQDNWTEMLLQRVKKGLSGGKDAIEFQLTPRSLGKLKISLSMQNDQTSLKIQTETAAAASLLGESEAKLAQMMETSGLRLAGLTSDHNPRFGDDGANHRGQQQAGASDKGGHGDQKDETSAARAEESTTGSSENLINIQA
jgi:flagellar hook-length control protein FliK